MPPIISRANRVILKTEKARLIVRPIELMGTASVKDTVVIADKENHNASLNERILESGIDDSAKTSSIKSNAYTERDIAIIFSAFFIPMNLLFARRGKDTTRFLSYIIMA